MNARIPTPLMELRVWSEQSQALNGTVVYKYVLPHECLCLCLCRQAKYFVPTAHPNDGQWDKAQSMSPSTSSGRTCRLHLEWNIRSLPSLQMVASFEMRREAGKLAGWQAGRLVVWRLA